MLREVNDVQQVPGDPIRRWFTNPDFDLIIWYDDDRNIIGFQLCYRLGPEQKALTWLENKGFSHKNIDDGEGLPMRPKMTPILVPDGIFDSTYVSKSFREAATELEPEITAFVLDKIAEL